MNTTNSGVIETVKDKSVAVIKGAEKIVETTVDTAAQILATTVKDTAKVTGEIGAAAKGLVVGTITGAREVGVKAEDATAAVAGGALKAAGEVASAAVDTVRTTVIKLGNSDKVVQKGPEMAVSKN
ncbi:MAG: hypothetical protein HY043_18225 [Verrucomicrobia bacterium]|nr:hypothetical protein [Verrucomicrobiota bacterium]